MLLLRALVRPWLSTSTSQGAFLMTYSMAGSICCILPRTRMGILASRIRSTICSSASRTIAAPISRAFRMRLLICTLFLAPHWAATDSARSSAAFSYCSTWAFTGSRARCSSHVRGYFASHEKILHLQHSDKLLLNVAVVLCISIAFQFSRSAQEVGENSKEILRY